MEIFVSRLVAALGFGVATAISTVSFDESVFVWTMLIEFLLSF